ncbi:MAG: hypothetical protein QXG40_06020 [Ignisphaera sp.]
MINLLTDNLGRWESIKIGTRNPKDIFNLGQLVVAKGNTFVLFNRKQAVLYRVKLVRDPFLRFMYSIEGEYYRWNDLRPEVIDLIKSMLSCRKCGS